MTTPAVIAAELIHHCGLPSPLVVELLDCHAEAKRRFHLGDLRPNAVEGGRFAEAAFRIVQHLAMGKHTAMGRTLPRLDRLVLELQNVPAQKAPESVRIHIPRTLRLIYDIRSKRDVVHLGSEIDPNLMDASIVIACIDWVMAELIRLCHGVDANSAQRIIDDLIVKAVPVVQEIDGQPVILKDLRPRDQALLMLYRAGVNAGLSFDGLAAQLQVARKDHLRARLNKLAEQKLVLCHPRSKLVYITDLGIREVETRGLAQPID